jgi:hypothetical protein
MFTARVIDPQTETCRSSGAGLFVRVVAINIALLRS